MAIALDPKTMVSSEELLISQVVSNEAIIRLLVEKGILINQGGVFRDVEGGGSEEKEEET